jgi:hypothetical protein
LKEFLEHQHHMTVENCIFGDEITIHNLLKKLIVLENERSKYECKICYDNLIDTYLMPCGHPCCLVCYLNHVEMNTLKCPFCKTNITGKNRLFIN